MNLLASLTTAGAVIATCLALSPAAAEIRPDSSRAVGLDGEMLDADEVVRGVLVRNTTLAAARAAWSEARARARQAGALDDPMLDLMTAPGSFGSQSVSAAYRIGVTQALPIFGQRGLRRRVAEAEARGMGWDLRTAQLDLVQEARTTFAQYWQTGRAIELNRELSVLLPELRRVALAKYAAGQVGQQEPLQIDATLAMLDHQAVVLERQRRVIAATLNVLMHRPAEASLPPPPTDLALPDTSLMHADLASHAGAMRPELRAAGARIEASRAQLSLARRQRLPEPSLGVAYDRFWSEPELRTSVGVTMNLPVHFARLTSSRAEAQARLAESEAQIEVIRDSIQLQVEVAATRLHEQAHDVAIARTRMVPLAERTLHAARASYEANRADFLIVLSSLRDYLQARLEADQSVAMLYQARADLDRALGEVPAPLQEEVTP